MIRAERFNTPTLCVVTKGIKADCNHLVKNIHPCIFLTASFCSVPPRRAGVLSRNDVLQKTSLCKTRKAIYNTDVVNWHTRFCLEPPASCQIAHTVRNVEHCAPTLAPGLLILGMTEKTIYAVLLRIMNFSKWDLNILFCNYLCYTAVRRRYARNI